MDISPRLGLPYIAPQQAQKQVTYNEAIRALDVLVQPAVISRTTATPPGSPAEGDTYIVAPSATGDWSGRDGDLATYVDGGWFFRTPAEGWLAYVGDDAEIAVCQSGTWFPLVATSGSSVAMFGINAVADATNRLAVAADASLFGHDGGDHRLKINKAGATDTASVLFQEDFTGHAEFGLTGDNDFHLKVSDDGSAWIDALTISRATGGVAVPAGQIGFPATQNASSDPHTLDDYEEGSFLPRIEGSSTAGVGTYSGQSGSYTKIGNLVAVTGFINLTSHTGTGNMLIAGLPFAQSGGSTLGVASFRVTGLSHAGGALQGTVVGTTIPLETEASGASASPLPMDTAFNMRFAVTYFA